MKIESIIVSIFHDDDKVYYECKELYHTPINWVLDSLDMRDFNEIDKEKYEAH